MSEPLASSSVLILSEDAELVDALIKNNKTDKQFKARDSVQFILDTPELLDGNSIVIFDVGSNDNDPMAATNNVLKIKQQDPTQVLIIIGEAEILSTILKSSIQPLIYRAFTKPISPNQIFLAFKSGEALHNQLVEKQARGIDITVVGPAENRTSVASLAGESKRKAPLFALLGVVAIGMIGWFLFNNEVTTPQPISNDTIESSVEEAPDVTVTEETVTVSGRAQEISRLNQAAANAMMLGQMIAPAGDNALDYYEQVLALDAYDTTAYQGKKQIADRLRESYNLLVSEAKFDKALNVISRLQRIEPLNMQNDALVSGLEKAIALHVKKVRESGSAEQVAQTSAVMDNIGNKLKSSNTASKALKKEKQLLGRIQAAFTDDNIVPPTKDNAYTLVSDALKANSISKANITPIVKQLNDRLVSAAESEFAANEEADIAKFLALIKRLNVDPASIAELNQLVVEREALLLARAAAAEAEKANGEGEEGEAEEAETDTPKIIPAKIISRAPPRYPTKAVNKQVEGWVEIKFIIDEAGVPINIKVTDSKPKDIFNSAAIKAVQKWRFSPARNEETGLPVESETTITKVQFKLE